MTPTSIPESLIADVYLITLPLPVVPSPFPSGAHFSSVILPISASPHSYWAIGLHPGAAQFFKFLVYLFLGVFAAESQSLLLASIVPIFVAALALSAFANGLWMVCQGYFLRASSLPKYIYYSVHFVVRFLPSPRSPCRVLGFGSGLFRPRADQISSLHLNRTSKPSLSRSS